MATKQNIPAVIIYNNTDEDLYKLITINKITDILDLIKKEFCDNFEDDMEFVTELYTRSWGCGYSDHSYFEIHYFKKKWIEFDIEKYEVEIFNKIKEEHSNK